MPGTRHALLPRRYPYFGPDPTTTPDDDQRCFSFPTPLAPGPACTPDFVCPRYYGVCDAPVPPNTLPRDGRLSPSLRWTRTCPHVALTIAFRHLSARLPTLFRLLGDTMWFGARASGSVFRQACSRDVSHCGKSPHLPPVDLAQNTSDRGRGRRILSSTPGRVSSPCRHT